MILIITGCACGDKQGQPGSEEKNVESEAQYLSLHWPCFHPSPGNNFYCCLLDSWVN